MSSVQGTKASETCKLGCIIINLYNTVLIKDQVIKVTNMYLLIFDLSYYSVKVNLQLQIL